MTYDIIIVGGGPAGFTAGIYAARGRMNTLLIESLSTMSQLSMTETIENYPGVMKMSGIDLIETFRKQAESFGLSYTSGTVERISSAIEKGTMVWRVQDENGEKEALSLIIASGARSIKLDVLGEAELVSKGVSYCATCDGAFFRGKDVVVVGGGDTAVEEAIFLTRFARKVKLVHRKNRLRATRILQERIFANKQIDFIWESIVESIEGRTKVEGVRLKNINTGERSMLSCEGVFIFVGWQPNTGFLKGVLDLDNHGNIIVDSDMRTSAKGIFAAGDCCKKSLHQVVTACGDGALAAFSSQRYIEEIKGTIYK